MAGSSSDKQLAWGSTVLLTVVSLLGWRLNPWMIVPWIVLLVLRFVVRPLMPALSRRVWPGFDALPEAKLKKSLWVNTAVSLLHSCVVSVLATWATWTSCVGVPNLMVAPTHSSVNWCLCVSLGYFFYDTWDFLHTGLWRKAKHIIVHHAVLVFCMWLGVLWSIGPRYLVLCLLCEYNSVFLHLRALMATAGKTLNDASYRHVWTWNWVTFYVTRFPSHGALFLLLIRDYSHWTAIAHPAFWFLAEGGLVVFNVLNVKLFFDVRKTEARDRKHATGPRT